MGPLQDHGEPSSSSSSAAIPVPALSLPTLHELQGGGAGSPPPDGRRNCPQMCSGAWRCTSTIRCDANLPPQMCCASAVVRCALHLPSDVLCIYPQMCSGSNLKCAARLPSHVPRVHPFVLVFHLGNAVGQCIFMHPMSEIFMKSRSFFSLSLPFSPLLSPSLISLPFSY